MTRKMILISAAGLAGLTGLVVTPAMAQAETAQADRKAPFERMFERADINGDGVITAGERDGVKAEMFATLDADANGFVTAEEFEAAHEARREAMRARFAERRTDRAERGDSEARPDGDRRSQRGGFGRRGGGHHDPVERLDTNADGMVSQAEFMAGQGGQYLDKIDANGDGDITRAEAEAAHEKMRERMKERRAERAAKREASQD